MAYIRVKGLAAVVAPGGRGGRSWDHKWRAWPMIYGIPIDTLVSVVVWSVAVVVLIPAVMGIIVIIYDIIEWRKRKK